MKVVFLDLKTLGYPMNVSGLYQFGEVILYDHAADADAGEAIGDADIVITNQNNLNEDNLKKAEQLKLICEAGTGYNNIDIAYCKSRGIAVTNVPGYAANSVAQHTFAMLFYLISHSSYYDQFTKFGSYSGSLQTQHQGREFFELEGKTWGIIGMGEIGKKVAQYARGFGCNIVYYSTSGKNLQSDFQRVSLEDMLRLSDILSVHAPLNDQTRNLIGMKELQQMKSTAYLLNLGRGGIIREADLADALSSGIIAGAGLDVFEQEPIDPESPLLKIPDKDRLYMTPHIAYASVEARERLMKIICDNIEGFFKQENRNRIV